jgi:hypothetical protein
MVTASALIAIAPAKLMRVYNDGIFSGIAEFPIHNGFVLILTALHWPVGKQERKRPDEGELEIVRNIMIRLLKFGMQKKGSLEKGGIDIIHRYNRDF